MTFMDPVATLVDDFKIAGGLVVDRRAAPVKNSMHAYVPQTAVPFTVNPVAAHNVTGRDLDFLPEADRNTETVQFYARDGSFPGGVARGWKISDDGFDADVVHYNGRIFRVVQVRNFSVQGRVWCAIGQLMEPQVSG